MFCLQSPYTYAWSVRCIWWEDTYLRERVYGGMFMSFMKGFYIGTRTSLYVDLQNADVTSEQSKQN